MRYATFNGQARAEAAPGARGLCPSCGGIVIAKTGAIMAWHWAHAANECDTWAEPDSAWHRDWQDQFPAAWQEAVIGPHRADIRTPAGVIVEFQHSSLPVADIKERERFYGHRMVWVFDVSGAYQNNRLLLRRKPGGDPRYRSFRWKHPRKTVATCDRPVFLDLGCGQLLRLRRYYGGPPTGGWGLLISDSEFVTSIKGDHRG